MVQRVCGDGLLAAGVMAAVGIRQQALRIDVVQMDSLQPWRRPWIAEVVCCEARLCGTKDIDHGRCPGVGKSGQGGFTCKAGGLRPRTSLETLGAVFTCALSRDCGLGD